MPATLWELGSATQHGVPSSLLLNNWNIKPSTKGIIHSSCWKKLTPSTSFFLAHATKRYTFFLIPHKTSHLNLGCKRHLQCGSPRTSTGVEREGFNEIQKQRRPAGSSVSHKAANCQTVILVGGWTEGSSNDNHKTHLKSEKVTNELIHAGYKLFTTTLIPLKTNSKVNFKHRQHQPPKWNKLRL